MSNRSLARFACLFALSVFGCDKPTTQNVDAAPSAQPKTSADPAGSSPEKTAAASAVPSASAAPANADKPLVGTWEARYDAKKGDVEMPPRVQDKVRSKDDGKVAMGPGTLTLIINKDLEVEGSMEGALGSATLRGKVEGDQVRAQFYPVDPLDKRAMFGMISGTFKDDRIEAGIRVASGDVTIVRKADIVLRKKP
jgi:hypothetical protein